MATLKTPRQLLYEAPNRNLFSEVKTGISLDSAPFGFVSEAKQILVSAQCAKTIPVLVCEELFYTLLTQALMDNQQRFEELANYRESQEPNEVETTTESPTTTTTTTGARDKTTTVNSKTTLSSNLQTETEPAKEDTHNETQEQSIDTVATTEKTVSRVKKLGPGELLSRSEFAEQQIARLLYDCLLAAFYCAEVV